MNGLFTDERIGREFLTADEVGSLPVGAVVIDSDGDAWQRSGGLSWFSPRGPEADDVDLVGDFGPLLLVWIPPGSELKPGPFPSVADHKEARHALLAGGSR